MNRLRELQRAEKLTQQELADIAEVSKRTIQNWEDGTSNIKLKKAEKLADYFGISVGYLLGYDDNDFKNETDIKVAVLDEALKKLHAIMVLAESAESPNLVEFGIGTAIAAIESFKKEIEFGGEE
ncbi:helix-turn-helix domain-containing protein [Streptococcus alactolyticus]|uniref:helix-turn-helix transcriptional regulator n=1 Tax=Streptococcus alactolyticus TaxID=29389 RepID=UPI00195E2F5F|nr:helix-turn-helix transcriptional regulator [Streptococcus alactolyticus]MBM6697546.1 helix-turn-helix domain-containing protein [Streptococcus alactolyticus]